MAFTTCLHVYLPFLSMCWCIVLPDVPHCVFTNIPYVTHKACVPTSCLACIRVFSDRVSQEVADEANRYWKETGIQRMALLKQPTSVKKFV